jgi:hypothetical protein
LKRNSRIARSTRATLDRACRGALAAADLRALESGVGRRRAGEQPTPIAEDDFRICADVDETRQLLSKVRSFGETHADGVRADMTGDAAAPPNTMITKRRSIL